MIARAPVAIKTKLSSSLCKVNRAGFETVVNVGERTDGRPARREIAETSPIAIFERAERTCDKCQARDFDTRSCVGEKKCLLFMTLIIYRNIILKFSCNAGNSNLCACEITIISLKYMLGGGGLKITIILIKLATFSCHCSTALRNASRIERRVKWDKYRYYVDDVKKDNKEIIRRE